MKILKNRFFVLALAAVLLVGTVATVYARSASLADESVDSELQTAKVRTGDLVITASGAGTVMPSAQVDLGFRTSGVVAEVDATLGGQVESGDVLANLDDVGSQLDFAQAEANLNWLFSPAGVAEYQIDMADAQDAYEAAVVDLQYYISPDVYYWEAELVKGQQVLNELNANTNSVDTAVADAEKAVERAMVNLKAAQSRYDFEYVPAMFTYTWIDEETRDEVVEVVPPSSTDIMRVRAAVEQTRLALEDAQLALEIVQNGDRAALEQSLSAADGTALAKIKAAYLDYENSRVALNNTRLIAPFDGSVTGLNIVKGQTVGTSPVVTLMTTDRLLVRFYLDETDVNKAAVGMSVNFVFDAYPDNVVTGEVALVEPTLQVVDGTPVVTAWASLPVDAPFAILSGMSVEVEVIAAETRDALLIPVQALRELSPGSYAVFVVSETGELKLTPVTVGLRDYANAEILSGLNAGDVVSTGNLETE